MFLLARLLQFDSGISIALQARDGFAQTAHCLHRHSCDAWLGTTRRSRVSEAYVESQPFHQRGGVPGLVRYAIRQILDNGESRLCDFGQYQRVDGRDDVLLRCAVLRQGRHERPTVARSHWSGVSSDLCDLMSLAGVDITRWQPDVGDVDSQSHRRSDADLDQLLAGIRLTVCRGNDLVHMQRRRCHTAEGVVFVDRGGVGAESACAGSGTRACTRARARTRARTRTRTRARALTRPRIIIRFSTELYSRVPTDCACHRIGAEWKREGGISRSGVQRRDRPCHGKLHAEIGVCVPAWKYNGLVHGHKRRRCVGCVHDDGDGEGPPEIYERELDQGSSPVATSQVRASERSPDSDVVVHAIMNMSR